MTAVCDVSKERASQVASAFGIGRVITSVDELIASDCDVVHVLLPPFLHEDVTRRLLEAGKSVFVEKPMGLSAGECKALAELAASRGLRLGVNHNFLFMPGYEAMRRDAASGALGTLDHLTRQLAVRARPDPVRPVQQLDPRLGRQPALRAGLAPRRVRHRSARPARRGGGGRVAADRAARQSACLSPLERRSAGAAAPR